MNRIFFFLLLGLFFISHVNSTPSSLKREEYGYITEEGGGIEYVCPKHLREIQRCCDIAVDNQEVNHLLPLFPLIDKKCDGCNGSCCWNKSVYKGYFDVYISRYFRHLKWYLNYCIDNRECKCYWPELSPLAAQINNLAYDLFEDLLSSTALVGLHKNGFCDCNEFYEPSDEYENAECDCNQLDRFFWSTPKIGFSESSIIAAFVSHSFFYSDYLHICQDLSRYCQQNYSKRDCKSIKDKLDDILDQLAPLFLKLYQQCLSQHPSERISKEKFIVECDLGKFLSDDDIGYELSDSLSHFSSVMTEVIHLQDKETHYDYPESFSLNFEFYLKNGVLFNDLLLYQKAIPVLTEAIRWNRFSKEAYIERAIAYFETNQIELALQDFEQAKKLTVTPPFLQSVGNLLLERILVPENRLDFSKGLFLGTLEGAKVSAQEFIPSTLHSLRGLGQGLWAFASSPIQTSQEYIDVLCACIDYMQAHFTQELLEIIVPELKELILKWDNLSDHDKGKKIGYVIGKYGIEILACSGAMKGIKLLHDLRRANVMFTLEYCSISTENKAKIIEESIRRWHFREQIFKKGNLKIHEGKQGKHIPGHKNFRDPEKYPRNAILTHKDPQKLIDEYAGTGRCVREGNFGICGYQEVVDFKETIGCWIPEKGPIVKHLTSKGKIHYSQEGVHIVPYSPE